MNSIILERGRDIVKVIDCSTDSDLKLLKRVNKVESISKLLVFITLKSASSFTPVFELNSEFLMITSWYPYSNQTSPYE